MVLLNANNDEDRKSKASPPRHKQLTDRKAMRHYKMRIDGIEKLVLRNMNQLRKENGRKHCDVVLIAKKKFYAHKLVLSSCSEYFRLEFEESETKRRKNKPMARNDVSFGSGKCDVSVSAAEMSVGGNTRDCPSFVDREKSEGKNESKEILILPGIHPDLLAIVLEYMYSSELVLGSKNVNEILFVACLLQVDSIINLCAEVLRKQPEWKSPFMSLDSLKSTEKSAEIPGKITTKKGSLTRLLAPTNVTWATGGVRPSSSARCMNNKIVKKNDETEISVSTSRAVKRSDKEKRRSSCSVAKASPRNKLPGLSHDNIQSPDQVKTDSSGNALKNGRDLSTPHLSRSSGDFKTGNSKRPERSGQERVKKRRMSSDASELQKINPDELNKEIMHSLAHFKTDAPYHRSFTLDKESSSNISREKQPRIDSHCHPALSNFRDSRRNTENTKNNSPCFPPAPSVMQERRNEWRQEQKRIARKKRTRCVSEVVGNTSGLLPGQDGSNFPNKSDTKPVCITPPASFRCDSAGNSKSENPMGVLGFPVQHVIRADYAPFLHYYHPPAHPLLHPRSYDMMAVQGRDVRHPGLLKSIEQPTKGQVYIHNTPNPGSVYVPHYDSNVHAPGAVIPNRWGNYTGTVMAIYASNGTTPNVISNPSSLDNKKTIAANLVKSGYDQSELVTKNTGQYLIGSTGRETHYVRQHPGLFSSNLSSTKVSYRPWTKSASLDLVTEKTTLPVTAEVAFERRSDNGKLTNIDSSSIGKEKVRSVQNVIVEKKSRTSAIRESTEANEVSKSPESPLQNVPETGKKNPLKYTEHHRRKRKLLSAAPETSSVPGGWGNKEKVHANGVLDPHKKVKCSSKDDIATRDCLDVSDPESDDSGRPSSV